MPKKDIYNIGNAGQLVEVDEAVYIELSSPKSFQHLFMGC